MADQDNAEQQQLRYSTCQGGPIGSDGSAQPHCLQCRRTAAGASCGPLSAPARAAAAATAPCLQSTVAIQQYLVHDSSVTSIRVLRLADDTNVAQCRQQPPHDSGSASQSTTAADGAGGAIKKELERAGKHFV